jgi:hypothetical protein
MPPDGGRFDTDDGYLGSALDWDDTLRGFIFDFERECEIGPQTRLWTVFYIKDHVTHAMRSGAGYGVFDPS